MDIHEQLAWQMAKARIAAAVRSADQMRAIGSARARRPTRVYLGGALVRLGHWMMGHA